MRPFLLALATLAVALSPTATATAPTLLAQGHIWVGDAGFLAFMIGDGHGVDGFTVPVPAIGTTLSTVTVSHTPVLHSLQISFWSSTRELGICSSPPNGEIAGCVVPPGTVAISLGAVTGADLDVQVYASS